MENILHFDIHRVSHFQKSKEEIKKTKKKTFLLKLQTGSQDKGERKKGKEMSQCSFSFFAIL